MAQRVAREPRGLGPPRDAPGALGDGRELSLDARLPAVAVAAVALALRAPFVVVVLLAAVTAAGLRALGWG